MTTPMSTALIPPEANAGEIARKELQSRLAGVGNLHGKNIDPAQKEKKLRESCEGFESIFIQKMWEEMRKTLPKSTLMHGKEEQFWQGMYDQELAKKMTSAGGIGLADMMYAQLSRSLTSASRSTASDASAVQRPFTPEAAPMIPPSAAADDAPSNNAGSSAKGKNNGAAPASSVYGGVAPMQDAGHAENGSAAANTLTGAQAAAGGQDPEEAARLAQQAMQASAQPERHKIVRTTNIPGNLNSGLNLARMAQFEAGSKLGPNTVRPSMQQMMGLAQPQRPAQPAQQNGGQGNGLGGGSGEMQMGASGMDIPPLTGDLFDAQPAQDAAGGQDPEEAARLAQQAMQASAQPERHKIVRTTNIPGNLNSGLNLARMAQFEAGSKLGPNTVRPSMQQMMGLAQPQRPAQPAQQNGGQGNGLGGGSGEMQMGASGMDIPPLTGDLFDAQPAQDATAMRQQQMQGQGGMPGQAQPPQPQKIRYTTNIPPTGRTNKQGPIRMLNVDGASPNSNAGAGIAAYHAQQAQNAAMQSATPAAGAQPTAPVGLLPMGPAGQPAAIVAGQPSSASGQPAIQNPVQPLAPAAPAAPVGAPAPAQGVTSPVPMSGGQIFVRQGGQNGGKGSESSGIPPLTATDVYGKP